MEESEGEGNACLDTSLRELYIFQQRSCLRALSLGWQSKHARWVGNDGQANKQVSTALFSHTPWSSAHSPTLHTHTANPSSKQVETAPWPSGTHSVILGSMLPIHRRWPSCDELLERMEAFSTVSTADCIGLLKTNELDVTWGIKHRVLCCHSKIINHEVIWWSCYCCHDNIDHFPILTAEHGELYSSYTILQFCKFWHRTFYPFIATFKVVEHPGNQSVPELTWAALNDRSLTSLSFSLSEMRNCTM